MINVPLYVPTADASGEGLMVVAVPVLSAGEG
jgi:hypothetical protein